MSNAKKNSSPQKPSTEAKASSSTAPALMPSLLDREIKTGEADAFGHRHFARALQSIVESEVHKPPYSVGLLGRWGTGKSSIKSLYLDDLLQDKRKDAKGLIRSDKVRIVTFNAWRFGGENIRRALLRHVFIELGGDESAITDALFNQVQRLTLVEKPWKDIAIELYDRWLFPLVQILILAAALIGLTALAKKLFGLTDNWAVTSVLAVQSLLAVMLVKYLLDAKRFVIPRYSNITRVELPSVSAEQFERLLIDQIVKYRDQNKKCERLVVFVDDLDRLSAEEMVGGLDAIRTFMEIPNEDSRLSDIGIVFVISCDEDRVADALANKRRDPGADLPGVIFSRTDARRYLDRIFQFRLEIPPFPRQDMRSFALDKFRNDLPEITDGIKRSGATIEEVVSRMIHVGVQSPRNALQIINAFVESWWMATHREREGSGSDRRGALVEGSVTGHALALAALCALRVDYPEFYNDLQKEPDLIVRFLDVFVHKGGIESHPEGIRQLLQKYAATVDSREAKDADTGVLKLKDGWRPLRQYLTSVESIPWPKSLQPLLLLSQDPLSRRIGDSGLRIYDAFVSGDAQGVLADLGRDKDEKPFEVGQVQWLRDLWEQIEADTDDRYDNAAAVLASMVDRLPVDQAGHLLVPLARRLTSSVGLRGRVGIDSIPAILPHVTSADRRRVAGKYVEDILLESGETSFKLPSGGTPNLDEAVEICRATVNLALSIRSKDGLEGHDDRRLLGWMMAPQVTVSGKAYQFSFADIEDWIGRYENNLLPDLGPRYLGVVASALSKKENEEMDVVPTSARITKVLTTMWETGEESRSEAWGLATRFVRVTPPEVNIVVQEFFSLHETQAPVSVTSGFLKQAASRILQFVSEKELDEADADAVRLMVSVTSSRSNLAGDTISEIASLATKLSQFDDKGESAAHLVRAIMGSYESEAINVVSAWVTRALSDLPEACVDLFAASFANLVDEAAKAALGRTMTTLVQATPDAAQGAKYRRLVSGLPEEAFTDDVLSSHWTTVLQRVAQSYSDIQFLSEIFPVMRRVIQHGPQSEASAMLNTLLSNVASYPESCGFVFQEMTGVWPAVGDLPGPYTPQASMQIGRQFIQAQPSNAACALIVASLASMYEYGALGPDPDTAPLLDSCLVVWPYQPDVAAKTMAALTLVPSPAEASTLARSLDTEDVAALEKVWRLCAENYEADEFLQSTIALLSEAQQSIREHPDGALYLWSGLDFELYTHQVGSVLGRSDLTSDQKVRSWKIVESRVREVPQELLRELIRSALLEDPDTAKSLLDATPDINQVFDTKDAKHDLAKGLVGLFPDALNLDSKNRIADWIGKLGNTAVLGAVNTESFNDDDIRILAERFPENTHLKKLTGGQEG